MNLTNAKEKLKTVKIDVGNDFSEVPAGRIRSDGPKTGEHFRRDFLLPAFEKNALVEIYLDSAEGYGSSFLEEAFGGLVRVNHLKKDFIKSHLLLNTEDKFLIDEIIQYIDEA